MPSRVIRGEINSSRSLSRVSLEADLTFRALIVAVDDYGRCDADPLMLKALLYPRREEVTAKKARAWVDENRNIHRLLPLWEEALQVSAPMAVAA